MQIENWYIVLFLACIGALCTIANKNIKFYRKASSNLIKLITVLSAASFGYFSRGASETDLALCVMSPAIPILTWLLFELIGRSISGINNEEY